MKMTKRGERIQASFLRLIMSKERSGIAYSIAVNDWKMCKVLKSLNGTSENNSPNQAIIHNDRFITSDKRRADIFIKHYADVSKIAIPIETRTGILKYLFASLPVRLAISHISRKMS